MQKIREAVLAAGGVDAYIAALKAEVQVGNIRAPVRRSQPLDTVLGVATDEMKALVGVRRKLKAMAVPYQNVADQVTIRLKGALDAARADTTLIAFIAAVKDPAFEEAVKQRGEVSMDLSVLKMLRDHVTNMITIALLVQYAPEMVKSGKPTFDQDWQIVIPAKHVQGMEGLPPELGALLSGLAARDGAEVHVIDASGAGNIGEVLSRLRNRMN